MIAKQLITDSVIPLKSSDSAANALVMMDEYQVIHMPIVDEQRFIGVISQADIFSFNEPDESIGHHRLPLNRAYVNESQHLFEVIRIFALHNLTLLPVLDNKNNFLGVITLPAIIREIPDITAISSQGGVIVLEVNEKDYMLGEIAQIVESNDAKILGMYVNAYPDSTQWEINLKINRSDIAGILQSFFRYNYIVKASWSNEETYQQDLQERFDSLMNYLNI